MNRPKVIIASIWAAAVILLIIGLAACGGTVHHHHDSHLPSVHGSQNGCHWVTSSSKHRVHKKINGRWKYVTVKTRSKSLVCHH